MKKLTYIIFLISLIVSCNSKIKNSETKIEIEKGMEVITEKIITKNKEIIPKKTSQTQETYYTIAPSGLIIREEPNINSNKTGKLPYGSIVKLLKNTELKHQTIDNGDTINGVWVKIKFDNFPFIVSKSEDYEYEEEGYVFNKYIEKLNKASVSNEEIDSLKFYSLYIQPKKSNVIKITSEKETEKLLDSKVKWKNVEYLGWSIDEITLDNGQILNINQKSNDYGFVAYYPTEEIILFEGGHTSDFSISIRTGESLETVGNPKYIIESPSKKFRLNGWFSGQECSNYFFQEKIGDNYTYLVDFGWGSDKFGENVCYFNKFCWLNDREFIYSYTDYSGKNGKEKYFIGKLNKKLHTKKHKNNKG